MGSTGVSIRLGCSIRKFSAGARKSLAKPDHASQKAMHSHAALRGEGDRKGVSWGQLSVC